MNEETLNLSIRKFLKMVGVNSQREIEHAVAKAIEAHAISGTEAFPRQPRRSASGSPRPASTCAHSRLRPDNDSSSGTAAAAG